MSRTQLSCVLLTPLGRGAIAVVAIFGDSLAEKIGLFFESATGKNLVEAVPLSIYYGRWRPTGEDVIVSIQPNHIEIHCHGGQAAPAAILKTLQGAGFYLLSTDQAADLLFDDVWTAELATCLSQAPTERTSEILLSQFHLAHQALSKIKKDCNSNNPEMRRDAKIAIQKILKDADFGFHLTKPWSVVLCGRPNVGKSSLINALVGFERAIVHSEAGTTRDVVTQLTAVEGWPIELKDTAGLREAKSEIERQGVKLSLAEIEKADLVLAVFDLSESAPAEFDWDFVRKNRVGIVVLNKSDLLTKDPVQRRSTDVWNQAKPEDLQSVEIILVSATQLRGIETLVFGIAGKLVPEVPPSDRLIPVSPKQVECLQNMLESTLF